jgi:hypothetical protein
MSSRFHRTDMIRACGFVRSKSLSAVQILVLWGCGNAADNYWQRLEGRTNRSISTRSSLPRWHDISENFAGSAKVGGAVSARRLDCGTRPRGGQAVGRRPEAWWLRRGPRPFLAQDKKPIGSQPTVLTKGEEGASSCALQRECRVAGPRLVILAGASIVGRPSWSVPSHPACRRHPDLQH